MWFEANYAPKMMGAVAPLMGLAATCATDKNFAEAMKKMDAFKKKQ